MTAPGSKVRRDSRHAVLGLATRFRRTGDEPWRDGKLRDLSMGGALVRCAPDITDGQRIELRFARISDGLEIEVAAEVTRTIGRGDAVAVRFLALTQTTAQAIAAVLNDVAEGAAETQRGEPEPHDAGPVPSLSTLRLHDVSLYDLLELEPDCDDGSLESKSEELIAFVAAQADGARGRREERLRILHRSLERMRPLWSDPVKRARYDLRWGYTRADERWLQAERGAGVHPHVLSGIWFDLYPDSVRTADKLMAMEHEPDDMAAVLKKAIELDPFCRRWRQMLAAIETPNAPAKAATSMPSEFVRGSLSDLPLRRLLRSVAEDRDDAEIVVRVGGKAIGVVGFTQGDLVTAICGNDRGLPALRALTAVREGTFQARYASPREHLRHMRSPALPLLDQALAD